MLTSALFSCSVLFPLPFFSADHLRSYRHRLRSPPSTCTMEIMRPPFYDWFPGPFFGRGLHHFFQEPPLPPWAFGRESHRCDICEAYRDFVRLLLSRHCIPNSPLTITVSPSCKIPFVNCDSYIPIWPTRSRMKLMQFMKDITTDATVMVPKLITCFK